MKPFRQLALAAIAAALSALASLAVAGEDPAAVRLDDGGTIEPELHASARPLRIWKPPVPAGIGPEI